MKLIKKLNDALLISQSELLEVLKKEVQKLKGITRMAKDTGLNRQNLYEMLATNGNPSLKNLRKILNELNLDIQIKER